MSTSTFRFKDEWLSELDRTPFQSSRAITTKARLYEFFVRASA